MLHMGQHYKWKSAAYWVTTLRVHLQTFLSVLTNWSDLLLDIFWKELGCLLESGLLIWAISTRYRWSIRLRVVLGSYTLNLQVFLRETPSL